MRIVDFPPLLIDPQRHDMEMLSGNVLVFENDIGLVAIPIRSMYSCAMSRNCPSVSLSSGEGFSETWKTVLVVLLLASR